MQLVLGLFVQAPAAGDLLMTLSSKTYLLVRKRVLPVGFVVLQLQLRHEALQWCIRR